MISEEDMMYDTFWNWAQESGSKRKAADCQPYPFHNYLRIDLKEADGRVILLAFQSKTLNKINNLLRMLEKQYGNHQIPQVIVFSDGNPSYQIISGKIAVLCFVQLDVISRNVLNHKTLKYITFEKISLDEAMRRLQYPNNGNPDKLSRIFMSDHFAVWHNLLDGDVIELDKHIHGVASDYKIILNKRAD